MAEGDEVIAIEKAAEEERARIAAGGAPPDPDARDPFDVSLDPFREALGRSRGIFGGAIGDLGGIAGQFGSMAADPFGTAGTPTALGMERDRALNLSRQGLARRGLGGSSIQANQQARLNQGFVEQGLGQQRANLLSQAGVLGQQTDTSEQGTNLELAIPSILTAQTAAENAGQGGGKK